MAMSLFRVQQGGTGTATQFTAGSVVFSTTSGVYTQDNANFFWDLGNHRLGIGTTAPLAPVQVGAGTPIAPSNAADFYGLNVPVANDGGNVSIYSTDTAATDKGGTLALGGKGAGAPYPFAVLGGRSEAGAAYSGYFQICTINAGGVSVEQMRVTSTGAVGIGTATPKSPLHVVTLPTYATNALAIAGGLTAGAFFKVNVAGEYFVHVVV